MITREKVLYALRTFDIKRWNIEPVLFGQTVGNHTARVIHWILLFCPNPSVALLRAAAWHDLAEGTTGDIPYKFKIEVRNNSDILDRLEKDIESDLEIEVVLTEKEKMWLKAADFFDAWIHAWREVYLLNNGGMQETCDRATKILFAMAENDAMPNNMAEVAAELIDGMV